MNPNMMYGQQMPMQPSPQRRHDGSYAPMPGQMRPHPGYQPYYHPQMGPMMSPYPQQYPPNWYGYQQAPMAHNPALHQNRPYPHYMQGPQIPPQYAQHHAPMVASHPHAQPSPRPMHQQLPQIHQPPPPSSSAQRSSMSSSVPVQAPPSPPLSTPGSSVLQKSSRASTPLLDVVTTSIEHARPPSPYYPPLPWISSDDQSFPKRAAKRKRKIASSLLATEPIVFPRSQTTESPSVQNEPSCTEEDVGQQEQDEPQHDSMPTPTQTATPLASEAPSDAPSDSGSTPATTPSSAVVSFHETVQRTPTQPKAHRATKSVVPAVPLLPQSPSASKRPRRDSVVSATSKSSNSLAAVIDSDVSAAPESSTSGDTTPAPESTSSPTAPVVFAPGPPKSWADLVRTKAAASAPTQSAAKIPNGAAGSKTETLSDVLNDMSITESEPASKINLLEPRGLVNTGNMCYMNSVLQVLVFCIPFYDFLHKLSLRAPHTFKSDTPLIDAMIMFMQEYPTIDSAASVEKLRLRLKPADFEKYGEPLIPEYVYDVIKQLPRFRDMRRGHQQDAQEFLGFLLEELHEECATAMRRGTSVSSGRSTPVNGASSVSEVVDNDAEWSEVGRKQKPSVVRSSGTISTESPVTNIFGGKLRSELKIQGNKMSVTLEPYQPLQLDIGSPQVNNIIDALKGITTPESMQGDFQSVRGKVDRASKQVFIETLPPVLILHLKRFHYDNSTKRTEKIWKKIGYPLELEIPKEVFPQQVRTRMAAHGGFPKYRLTGVIYHHGKNANGGHYTVDLRRQDGSEWIRLDDTLIRRIRSEDVAEGGSEENPRVLAAALERHKEQKATGNRFEQIEQDEDEEENASEKTWNQVNGHSRSKSTMSAIMNGSATPAKGSSGIPTPSQKSSVKDNKVAYLLFYQRTAN